MYNLWWVIFVVVNCGEKARKEMMEMSVNGVGTWNGTTSDEYLAANGQSNVTMRNKENEAWKGWLCPHEPHTHCLSPKNKLKKVIKCNKIKHGIYCELWSPFGINKVRTLLSLLITHNHVCGWWTTRRAFRNYHLAF